MQQMQQHYPASKGRQTYKIMNHGVRFHPHGGVFQAQNTNTSLVNHPNSNPLLLNSSVFNPMANAQNRPLPYTGPKPF